MSNKIKKNITDTEEEDIKEGGEKKEKDDVLSSLSNETLDVFDKEENPLDLSEEDFISSEDENDPEYYSEEDDW